MKKFKVYAIIIFMKTKAIIFDFDGTLTINANNSTSSWGRVWRALDDIETDNKLYNMFSSGEIDDEMWIKLIEERYVELNLQESVCENLAQEICLIDGIENSFKFFNENGIKIYILSGGVRNIIENKLKNLKQFITRIEGYNFIFENRNFKQIERRKEPLDNKHKYVEQIKKENNLSGNEILFVGNGSNDQTVYLSKARTLCINPEDADYKNKKYWNNYIEKCNNLTEIIKYL